MSKVLVVYHTISGNTEKAAEFIAKGAEEAADEVVVKKAVDTDSEDLLSCDAIAVGTPDYFSYMAGMIKDFFDRTYYPTQGDVKGKPCITFVTHGGGGRAKDSIQGICETFEFDILSPPVMVKDSPDEQEQQALREAGGQLAGAIES